MKIRNVWVCVCSLKGSAHREGCDYFGCAAGCDWNRHVAGCANRRVKKGA